MVRRGRPQRPVDEHVRVADVLDDLAAEYDELDRFLTTLDDAEWDAPTPAIPFTVRDQLDHLAFSEELASTAVLDAPHFRERLEHLMRDRSVLEVQARTRARHRAPTALLGWWREARAHTLEGLRRTPPDARVPWVVGAMSVASFATARLMETWAHGQDVYDGLGRSRQPTSRLRHIAHLGVSTRGFSYRNRGLEPPAPGVRVELEGPGGERWSWGDEELEDVVAGPAEDFCLVVTQRRHLDDTALSVRGASAVQWMSIAQAFAGPPTDGRPPRRG